MLRIVELRTRNFRSLEDVALEGLKDFNVLIGRNSSGKSATLEALAVIGEGLTGRKLVSRTTDWPQAVTARDTSLTIQFELIAQIDPTDRLQFIEFALDGVRPRARYQRLRDGAFASQLFASFSVRPASKAGLVLNEVRMQGDLPDLESWPRMAVRHKGKDIEVMGEVRDTIQKAPDVSIGSQLLGVCGRMGGNSTSVNWDFSRLGKMSEPPRNGFWPLFGVNP